MINITNIETFGWEAAIRGMRNSYASWNKSDSYYEELTQISSDGRSAIKTGEKVFHLGPNDLELASNLAKLGGSHAKFRRMIHVQCDILAPLFWWKQFDTYKIGTVVNSTSTMHSITKKEFTSDDFSQSYVTSAQFTMQLLSTIDVLNKLRSNYLEEENRAWKKMYWNDIIHLLPDCYNQLRTVDMNYEVVAHMIKDRFYHKLDEWQEFCHKMLVNLPYARELILNIKFEPDNTGEIQ